MGGSLFVVVGVGRLVDLAVLASPQLLLYPVVVKRPAVVPGESQFRNKQIDALSIQA